MISMNKFLASLERWFENPAQPRVNACLLTLDRDPWSLHTIPSRRYAELNPAELGDRRTKTVRPDCTIAGQPDTVNHAVGLRRRRADAAIGETETPRSAA